MREQTTIVIYSDKNDLTYLIVSTFMIKVFNLESSAFSPLYVFIWALS